MRHHGRLCRSPIEDHGELSGLADDDHSQYIKDSEFTQDSGVLVGTGAGTFQEETGATARTSLGLGTGDSPTFTGLTITGNSVFGLNSSVFQPTTDSTTFFQVLDADGGVPIFNVDSTNERVGIKTATPNNSFQVANLIGFNDTDYNITFGTNAGLNLVATSAIKNIYIGYDAGKGGVGSNVGDANFAAGHQALISITSGANIAAIGYRAAYQTTTGGHIMAIGSSAIKNNTGGSRLVGIGSEALLYTVLGSDTIGIGTASGRGSSEQSQNRDTYIGSKAGYSHYGDDCLFFGFKSGYNQTTNNALLIIDNQDRGSTAAEITDCLMYGLFDATASSQILNLNAKVLARYGVQTIRATDDVADPPTDAELDTAFGIPATVGEGFVGILDDNDAGTDVYICFTTGTDAEWFYVKGTKAA